MKTETTGSDDITERDSAGRNPAVVIDHKPAPLWLVVAAFAAVYIIWGSTYLGIRYAVQSIPPFLMAGARHLTAGLALLCLRSVARGNNAIVGAVARCSHRWNFNARHRQRGRHLGGTTGPLEHGSIAGGSNAIVDGAIGLVATRRHSSARTCRGRIGLRHRRSGHARPRTWRTTCPRLRLEYRCGNGGLNRLGGRLSI